MSRPVPCDDHPQAEGVMMVTNCLNGEVATLCANCVGPWCLALATQLMPDAFQDIHLTAEADAAGLGEGEAAPDPPLPKRRRGGALNGSEPIVEPDPEPWPPDAEAEDQVPAELEVPASPFPDIAPDRS